MNQSCAPLDLTSTAAPVVTRVETVILDLPTVRPHKLSVATMDGQVLMLVRVHCSDGITGLVQNRHTPLDGSALSGILTVGGTIPADDIPELKGLGVAELFTPGSSTQEIVDYIRGAVGS